MSLAHFCVHELCRLAATGECDLETGHRCGRVHDEGTDRVADIEHHRPLPAGRQGMVVPVTVTHVLASANAGMS
jgi:hypothetical protein